MLKLNFKEKKPVWVKFEMYDEEGGKLGDIEFLIKPLSLSEINEIIKKATVRKKVTIIDGGRRRTDYIDETDNVKLSELMFDAICVDWKGLKDENGNDVVCNNENKKIIVEYYPDIVNFCIDESKKIGNFLQEKKEEEIKN